MSDFRKLQEIRPKMSGNPVWSPPQKPPDDIKGLGKRIGTACEPCRKRKTRCDGENPCSACLDRNATCRYDYASDRRRKEHVNRDISILRGDRSYLSQIIRATHQCDGEKYNEVMNMLHAGRPLAEIAGRLELDEPPLTSRSLRGSIAGTGTSGSSVGPSSVSSGALSHTGGTAFGPSSPSDHSGGFPPFVSEEASWNSRSRLSSSTLDGTARRSSSSLFEFSIVPEPMLFQERMADLAKKLRGPLSAFPVWQQGTGPDFVNIAATSRVEIDPRDVDSQDIARSVNYWTSAIIDPESITYLFSLYDKIWGDSVYRFINFRLFMGDMVPSVASGEIGGTGNFYFACDLANAVLAVSCFFCTRPCAFADICEPVSRGEHFIHEATNQIKMISQVPNLPTAQAYACLALAEGCRGRQGSSRRLWLLCFDMFLSLLRQPNAPSATETRSEEGQQPGQYPPRTQTQQLLQANQQSHSLKKQVEDQRREHHLSPMESAATGSHMSSSERLEGLKGHIRRSILAIGLFCVESIYLTAHNAPPPASIDAQRRGSEAGGGPLSATELFRAHQHQSNLATTSNISTTTTATSPQLDLTDEENNVIEVVAALKLALASHPPPGFLTPEHEDSGELLQEAADRLSIAFPELRAIYKQLAMLMGGISD